MTILWEDTEVHLKGDWTITSLLKDLDKINFLAVSLQKIGNGNSGSLRVDCRDLGATDTIGLELLNTWMRIVRVRGIKPELVNVPDNMQKSLKVHVLQER